MALRKGPKIALLAIVVGGLIFAAIKFAGNFGYLDGKKIAASQDVGQIDLPTAPANAVTAVPPRPLPSAQISTNQLTNLGKCEVWQWNAHFGAFLANGGPQTTGNSIMESHGVKINFVNQEDVPLMQQNLFKFAKAYKESGGNSFEGTQYVTIMGDAGAQFLEAVNSKIKDELGDEYIAQVFYSCGASAGEDAFMAPPEVKGDPQMAKGLVVSTVVRDGDWNIVVKWAGDNKIRINPDIRTYDPEAINFIAADNNGDAAQKYVSGYSEERPVVKNGKPTGEKKTIVATAASVWTPADVTVATGKGGLIRIVSTKEYASQMPNVMIGIKKHLEANRKAIEDLILAFGEGADQVKSYSKAMHKAGEISFNIYKANSPAYWVKYYQGVVETDKKGLSVQLGGSRVHNLADNLNLFGLAEGSVNVYEIVYNNFGNIVKKLYPDVLSEFPKASEVINTSFLSGAASRTKIIADANTSSFDQNEIVETVSKRSWAIEFVTGSAEFTPAALSELEEMFAQLTIADKLKVDITGHTDNTGSEAINQPLSEARANAVKTWLESKSKKVFPANRIHAAGFGSSKPIGDNNTEFGRSKNRRVEIVLGS